MENWKHLLVRVDQQPRSQVTVVPSPADLDSRFVLGTGDRDLVELLDELGRMGWQLVAVQGREFWMRQQAQ